MGRERVWSLLSASGAVRRSVPMNGRGPGIPIESASGDGGSMRCLVRGFNRVTESRGFPCRHSGRLRERGLAKSRRRPAVETAARGLQPSVVRRRQGVPPNRRSQPNWRSGECAQLVGASSAIEVLECGAGGESSLNLSAKPGQSLRLTESQSLATIVSGRVEGSAASRSRQNARPGPQTRPNASTSVRFSEVFRRTARPKIPSQRRPNTDRSRQ